MWQIGIGQGLQVRSLHLSSNFHPPCFGKNDGKEIAKQLSFFCDNKHIVMSQQVGFRFKSSQHSLLDGRMDAIDQGMYVAALLIELTKAFDKVSHQKLWSALVEIGCSNQVPTWFIRYFLHWTQSGADKCDYWPKIMKKTESHKEVVSALPLSISLVGNSGISPTAFNISGRKLQLCSINTYSAYSAWELFNATSPALRLHCSG